VLGQAGTAIVTNASNIHAGTVRVRFGRIIDLDTKVPNILTEVRKTPSWPKIWANFSLF
jgi:hypothetical protein